MPKAIPSTGFEDSAVVLKMRPRKPQPAYSYLSADLRSRLIRNMAHLGGPVPLKETFGS